MRIYLQFKLVFIFFILTISTGISEEIDTSCGQGLMPTQCNVSCNKSMFPCLNGCPDQPKDAKWNCIENCRQQFRSCLGSCDLLCEGNEPNSPSGSTESVHTCLEWQATIFWGGQHTGKTDKIETPTRESCENKKARVAELDTPSTITDCICTKYGYRDARENCWFYDMYTSGKTVRQPLMAGFTTQDECEEHLKGRKREGGSFGSSCYCKMENIQETPFESVQKPESISEMKRSNNFQKPDTKRDSMVFITAGEFWMGCNDQINNKCDDADQPYHKVYLDNYYIDKYEVTQGEYNECVQARECTQNLKYNGFTDDRQPVVGVNWNQSNTYCQWAGKRLPSEAEWEKAARGPDGRIYPWGNRFEGNKLNFCDMNCNLAWSNRSANDGYDKTAPVGSFTDGASPYGAMDMAGNVREWVADWYDIGYYQISPLRNPNGPSSGKVHVVRGGGWRYDENLASTYHRNLDNPTAQSDNMGFRCTK